MPFWSHILATVRARIGSYIQGNDGLCRLLLWSALTASESVGLLLTFLLGSPTPARVWICRWNNMIKVNSFHACKFLKCEVKKELQEKKTAISPINLSIRIKNTEISSRWNWSNNRFRRNKKHNSCQIISILIKINGINSPYLILKTIFPKFFSAQCFISFPLSRIFLAKWGIKR